MGGKFHFEHFDMLRNHLTLRTFFNPENLLADENQLFPCLPLEWDKKGYFGEQVFLAHPLLIRQAILTRAYHDCPSWSVAGYHKRLVLKFQAEPWSLSIMFADSTFISSNTLFNIPPLYIMPIFWPNTSPVNLYSLFHKRAALLCKYWRFANKYQIRC